MINQEVEAQHLYNLGLELIERTRKIFDYDAERDTLLNELDAKLTLYHTRQPLKTSNATIKEALLTIEPKVRALETQLREDYI